MPPAIRPAPPAPPRIRQLGPTIATAVVVGGLVIWRLAPAPVERVEATLPAPERPPPVDPAPSEEVPTEVVAAAAPDDEPADDVRERAPPTGRLTVQSVPSAEVWIDGDAVGETPIRAYELSAGPHRVMLLDPEGGATDERTVEITEGETHRLMVQLGGERAPSPRAERRDLPGDPTTRGTLAVNTRPWSQVYVDGELIGMTPQMSISLAAGRHVVTCVNDTFRIRESREVVITAGETERLILTLTPGGDDTRAWLVPVR